MASAKDVARVFNYLSMRDNKKSIEKTRLIKLLYYAQGHALSELGHKLFENNIDAWVHGPVVAVVYNGYEKITEATGEDCIEKISINPDDMEIIMDVWNQYGGYSANELVEMTHEKDTPWSKAYIEGKKNIHISPESMTVYFSMPQNRLNRAISGIGKLPTVNVLPTDEYDPDEDAVWEALLNDAK